MGLSQIQKPRNSDILTKQERERERESIASKCAKNLQEQSAFLHCSKVQATNLLCIGGKEKIKSWTWSQERKIKQKVKTNSLTQAMQITQKEEVNRPKINKKKTTTTTKINRKIFTELQ